MDKILWLAGFAAAFFVLDRVLLFFEGRGWIYYRRTKAGRGASTYHLLEWTSVLDPSQRQVIELRVSEERQEALGGDPQGRKEGESGAEKEEGRDLVGDP